jgi:hypothetical protein
MDIGKSVQGKGLTLQRKVVLLLLLLMMTK